MVLNGGTWKDVTVLLQDGLKSAPESIVTFCFLSSVLIYVYFYVKMEVIVSEQTVYTPVIYCLNVYLEIYDKFRKNANM